MRWLWIGIGCLWLTFGVLPVQAQRSSEGVPRAPSKERVREAKPPRKASRLPAEAPRVGAKSDNVPGQVWSRPYRAAPVWVVAPPPPPPKYVVAFHFWKHPAHRHRPFRYRLRQWLYWDVRGWGPVRPVWLEVEVVYRARLRAVYAGFVVVDLWVETVRFYDRGRYWGHVIMFPPALQHLEARFYADGRMVFERMVFLGEGLEAGLYLMAGRGAQWEMPEFIGRVDLARARVEALPGSDGWPQMTGAWVPLLPTDGAWYAVEDPRSLAPREDVQRFTVEGQAVQLSRRLVLERLE